MPTRPPTRGATLVREAMSRRRTPFAHRCGYVRAKRCHQVQPPELIGVSNDLGYVANLYQCPVCHQVMTEFEAFG